MSALASDLPSRNGWSVAEHAGDRTPDRSQRLLSRASWDESAAMSQVRRYAAAGLDEAARRSRRRRMAVGALDETGQEKQGSATAGVKRQYMGCAGPGRERDQHRAPVLRAGGNGARADRGEAVDPGRGHRRPGEVAGHGPAAGPAVPDQGAAGDRRAAPAPTPTGCRSTSRAGTRSTAAAPSCGSSWRAAGRPTSCASRPPSCSPSPPGARMTCADAVRKLLKGKRAWEVRSAGQGSKGERWYAWAWLGTASPRHSLLIRRHLKTGELAFHYCYVPARASSRPRPGSSARRASAGPWKSATAGTGQAALLSHGCVPCFWSGSCSCSGGAQRARV